MNQFPHVRVAGTAAERGRQYGEQARERVNRSVAAYREVFAHYAGWDWGQVRAAAARFEAPIHAFRPAHLEEMRGIAEGAGVEFLDVLAVNVRTEVMFAARARQAVGEQSRPPAECTAFGAVPAPGTGGHTLAGQNWDWLPHASETVVVLEAQQQDGPDFVTVVEAGLLAKTGLNSAGLGLVTNALVTADDAGLPGVPYHVMLRALLECQTMTDALAVLHRSQRSSAANYLLVHQDGIAVDVEAAPGDFSGLFLLFPSEDGTLLHTNHFLSPRLDRRDVSVWLMPDSPIRLHRMQAGLAARGDRSLADFRALLADHANYPAGVCCHPDPRAHRYDQDATIVSVLMDVTERRMWIADGPPCSAPYRELDYRDFLAKPSPAAGSALPAAGTI